MRNTYERLAEVKKRVHAKRMHKIRMLELSAFAAAITIIVCAATIVPKLIESAPQGSYDAALGAASIFSQGGFISYIVIAMLSFALGICVTTLCYYAHKKGCEDCKGELDDRNN